MGREDAEFIQMNYPPKYADLILTLDQDPKDKPVYRRYVKHRNGNQTWYDEMGRFHREDGPAIIFVDGVELWYYHGKPIVCQTQEEFVRILKLKAFW
jgi:hypothetical protein